MTADAIALRNCTELEEFRACVALQKEVWGFADNELVPLRIFSLAPKIGGQVIGAWDGETLVGFAFSIPGTRSGHPYLHSHMLAVKDGYRDTGLGRRIKLFQREDAIAHGYELLEWTFDPLEIKNAYLNLERLGRDRAPLQHQPVRHHLIAAAGISAHRSPGGGVVADLEARRRTAFNRQASFLRARRAGRSTRRHLCLEGTTRNPAESGRGSASQSRAISGGVLARAGVPGL